MTKLEKLKDTPLRNVTTVIRYSGFQLLRPETVDAHTMDMAVLALKVVEILSEKDIDKRDLVYRIVVHDLEEAASCDIPRPVKYYDDEVHAAIERATKGLVRRHVSQVLYEEMENAKDLKCIEGRIIKFLDIFQCCLVLDREVNGYGNLPLTPVLNEAKAFLNKAIVQDDLFKDDPMYIREFFREVIKELNVHITPNKNKGSFMSKIGGYKSRARVDIY